MKKYAATGQRPPWHSFTSTQKTQTYDAVKAAGEDGITREDICKNTNLPKQRVWFYLSELRRAGLIKRTGDALDITSLSPLDAKLHALTVLENALVINAHASGVTPEIEKGFGRYQKIKSLALGAKTGPEEKTALRTAVIELVKLVF